MRGGPRSLKTIRKLFPVNSYLINGARQRSRVVGIVVGYNESMEEPEVIARAIATNELFQFSSRTTLYKRPK